MIQNEEVIKEFICYDIENPHQLSSADFDNSSAMSSKPKSSASFRGVMLAGMPIRTDLSQPAFNMSDTISELPSIKNKHVDC